ncbi:alpha/beta hydrolase [Methylicorpusculum oleiharenae]|uniref:alpha/beta fold hydrolase n=1 Tax=Methylicorpusculum oleiharenae TaxID=1338687 RepID=UPI0013569F39|nr:alpha/beta hydrolase [Methylicorpusculum oleiharenae]MCD2453257.1 alpha/beta hydrolase [Methylicorpusculum oleiharenae]
MTDRPFLLLRGLARESRYWGDFTGYLAKTFPDRPILTPDIPGNGPFWQQTSPSSIGAMTQSLRSQLTIAGPMDIIGLSMGGMIALDWMNRFREDIASGILINTSASPLSPFYQRLRWQTYPALFRPGRLDINRREQLYLNLTSRHHQLDADLLKQWQAWQQEHPVSQANTLRQLRAAASFRWTQRTLQPVLIAASQTDQLVDFRCNTALASALHCELIVHPTAGHDLPLDDPGWLCDQIKQWLTQLAIDLIK